MNITGTKASRNKKRPGGRQPGSCPFFWPGENPSSEEPAYLVNYQQRFVCRYGRHASLLTYQELLACLEGDTQHCPFARGRP